VFFGRWIAGLRVWASWLAGMTSMPWRRFLVWNALGGVGWAICFGLLGYFVGTAASHVVERVGLVVAIVVVSGLLAAYGLVRWRLRRRAVRP
jgi:membrane-associated protein